MTVLAIESSAKSAGAAVVRDGAVLAQSFQNNGLTHSQTLLPIAASLLDTLTLTMDDIDLIAVTTGPGSFTGLRIGTATAAGLAWAGGKSCVGISSLEACAMNVAHMPVQICAVMDARRGEVYGALFEGKDGALLRLTPDAALPAFDMLKAAGRKKTVLVGDGACLCAERMKDDAELRAAANFEIAPVHLRFPLASSVALLAEQAAAKGLATDAFQLRPNYLRVSQAERERAEKQQKGATS